MTRHGSNIGTWIFTVVSMLISPNLAFPISVPSNPVQSTPISCKSFFPTLFWGQGPVVGAETFCIFRNYGFLVDGLGSMGIHHQTEHWRIDVENEGSREWHSLGAKVHYALNLSPRQRLSVGLGGIKHAGLAADMQSQSKGGAGIFNAQYQRVDPKWGTIAASYQTCLGGDQTFLKQWLFGATADSPFSSWQYEQAHCNLLWMGRNSLSTQIVRQERSKNPTIPFVLLHYGAQRQYLEVGMIRSFSRQWQGLLAIKTTNQPLRWGVIYSEKSWSGGLDVQWHRPLGLCVGWQVRYHWR